MRKHTKIVIWCVVVVFALLGGVSVNNFFDDGRVAGKVFGKEISYQEYNTFYKSSQVFATSDKPLSDPELIKQHAWQGILFSYEAKRQGIEVTDDEVRAEVVRILQQQGLNPSNVGLYEQWLSRTLRSDPKEFEFQIREFLRIQKLVQQFNEQPLDEPDDAQIEAEVKSTRNEFDAAIARFDNEEDAAAFLEKVKNPKRWKKEFEKLEKKVENSGRITIQAWVNLWKIPEEKAVEIHGLEVGGISQVVPVGEGFGVLKMLDKTLLDPEKFEEWKEEAKKRSLDQQRFQRFARWNQALQEQANVMDFTTPEPTS